MIPNNSLSEFPSQKLELSSEALNRATKVANTAIDILTQHPEGQEAVENTFSQMISEKLRDPGDVMAIQEQLYAARDARLAGMEPSKRLGALEAFSRFMEQFSQNAAYMNRDIWWSNDMNAIRDNNTAQVAWVKATYAWIIKDHHPTQTA